MKRTFLVTLLLAFIAFVAIANINRKTGVSRSEKQTEQKTEKKKECKHSCLFS